VRDANFVDLPPDELKLYFTLTRRAETPQPTPRVAPLGFEPQMVRIPAGPFLMGSTPLQIQEIVAKAVDESDDWNWLKREEPQHQVILSEYLIAKYPVTNREYQAFIRNEKYLPPEDWNGDQYPKGRGDHPITNVSWRDAKSYCEWLSNMTAKVYRLPTEAEWEKAARGDKDARIYPWGDEFDLQNCNVEETGFGDTVPVDWFSPQGDSPYGCACMVGNVWEWCADWFDENVYKNRVAGAENPVGPNEGVGRIVRGGSYNFSRDYARCAIRGKDDPGFYFASIGFRVVLSATSSETSS
jgi:formylglycine-generating enzyme required for sulfatase activity